MTAKPTIFLSHSSSDGPMLGHLKDLLHKRTGGVYDIFLSSDGTSIPFGRNWSKEVEDGLERARLMFVFLTEASMDSPWIYFESGFAYAKGVQVVPIGLGDVDLGKVQAPLSLLQGFNLADATGLNNLLAIANGVFDHAHALSFSQQDFEAFVAGGRLGPRMALGPYADAIDEVRIELRWVDGAVTSESGPGAFVRQLQERLVHDGVECVPYAGELILPGASVATTSNLTTGSLTARVDRLAIHATMPSLLEALFPLPERLRSMRVLVVVRTGVQIVGQLHKRTARLIGTEARVVDNRRIGLGDVEFEFTSFMSEPPTHALQITRAGGLPSLEEIRAVVDLAFSSGLLTDQPA